MAPARTEHLARGGLVQQQTNQCERLFSCNINSNSNSNNNNNNKNNNNKNNNNNGYNNHHHQWPSKRQEVEWPRRTRVRPSETGRPGLVERKRPLLASGGHLLAANRGPGEPSCGQLERRRRQIGASKAVIGFLRNKRSNAIHSRDVRSNNLLNFNGNERKQASRKLLAYYVDRSFPLCMLFSASKQSGQGQTRPSQFEGPRRPIMLTTSTSLVCITLMIIMLANSTPVAESVDCFKCSSRNGSNPACEDPFHNLNTTRITSPVLPDPPPNVIYHTPCYAGKKGREGLFPASACIKLTGTFDATGETLVVRHCALDSGTLTQDTELARMSHCGKFQFEGDLLKGCVLACPEDACNSAPRVSKLSTRSIIAIFMAALLCWLT